MLNWMRRKKDDAEEVQTGPLGLVIGGSWHVDFLRLRSHQDALQFEAWDGHSVIVAHGIVDLGDGMVLHRFYDDDDHLLQVLAAKDREDQIEEITLFQPFDSVQPNSATAWQEWTAPHGWMRAREYELDDGTVYQRTWFADDPGTVELVQFSENVYRDRTRSQYDVIGQACMLFSRDVPDAGSILEHLLVIEERTDAGRTVELLVGVDVAEPDLKIF